MNFGAVHKNGNSYSFGEEKLGVGRENAKAFLRANPKVLEEIRRSALKAVLEQEKQES